MSKVGVFLPQRTKTYDHSINYVNQSLVQDIINRDSITTLYQNCLRIRSGKISNPHKADESIEWILRSFENLKVRNYNIKIVPVSINYDRLFDSNLLVKEMLSGQFQDMNLYSFVRRIYNMPLNKLGKIFVKY